MFYANAAHGGSKVMYFIGERDGKEPQSHSTLQILDMITWGQLCLSLL